MRLEARPIATGSPRAAHPLSLSTCVDPCSGPPRPAPAREPIPPPSARAGGPRLAVGPRRRGPQAQAVADPPCAGGAGARAADPGDGRRVRAPGGQESTASGVPGPRPRLRARGPPAPIPGGVRRRPVGDRTIRRLQLLAVWMARQQPGGQLAPRAAGDGRDGRARDERASASCSTRTRSTGYQKALADLASDLRSHRGGWSRRLGEERARARPRGYREVCARTCAATSWASGWCGEYTRHTTGHRRDRHRDARRHEGRPGRPRRRAIPSRSWRARQHRPRRTRAGSCRRRRHPRHLAPGLHDQGGGRGPIQDAKGKNWLILEVQLRAALQGVSLESDGPPGRGQPGRAEDRGPRESAAVEGGAHAPLPGWFQLFQLVEHAHPQPSAAATLCIAPSGPRCSAAMRERCLGGDAHRGGSDRGGRGDPPEPEGKPAPEAGGESREAARRPEKGRGRRRRCRLGRASPDRAGHRGRPA